MRLFFCLLCAFASFLTPAKAAPTMGIARVDVTPDYPVRLSGYGSRRAFSEGVEQRIWGKALAFDTGGEHPALLITVDNCGVPFSMRLAVLRQLQRDTKLKPERFAILSSHTHSAPMLNDMLPNIFSMDLTEADQKSIDHYHEDLTRALVKLGREALSQQLAAKLSWGIGTCAIAENRRYGSGPTDDDLPVLRITSPSGELLAVFANYACHCTAISGTFNRICGDWAGYAQSAIEAAHPGTTALIGIGCAGDQRPAERFGLNYAKQHGATIAALISSVLQRPDLESLPSSPDCAAEQISLPFDKPVARAEWETRAKSKTQATAHHAKRNLERLDRGESLQTEQDYYVQRWSFGDDLLMVFLPGEVVVDYAVRLKHEFDAKRVWVNAYANDVPSYIPSERVLREGGYEGESSMRYYNRPNKYAPGIEHKIFAALRTIIPATFESPDRLLLVPPLIEPRTSTSHITTKPGYYVQLVASEPDVIDPVAIDFGLDGRLWVAEMNDYPAGPKGNYQPGGRIRILEDTDSNGTYENGRVFLDNIPFPTGITTWGRGALICAAPDILYAEDTDGDGRADVVEKRFSGFITDNYQARVNSIELGLDNWFHTAGGLRGGTITWPGMTSSQRAVVLGSRDFRFSTDFRILEPDNGPTQQGLVHDDWGNLFGCANSSTAFGYPMPNRYADRNPHVSLPTRRANIPTGDNPERIYPTSELAQRFNRPSHYNRVTSGCGIGIHRDSQVGAEFYGDVFTCEPVHNVVRRLKLKQNGPVFTGHRTEEEQTSEFLSSSDPWFRPAQVRTGPDGALWVVDMYRSVIEHPRWIPEARLKELDVRGGADRGRIYRVLPSGSRVRKIPNLSKLTTAALAQKLDSPNGSQRDLIQRELIYRQDRSAIPNLQKLAASAKNGAVRVHALSLLEGLSGLTDSILVSAMRDPHPEVRRIAVRIMEQYPNDGSVGRHVLKLMADPNKFVRYQVALNLGGRENNAAGKALGQIAAKDSAEPWIRAAVLSSSLKHARHILAALAEVPRNQSGRSELIGQLLATLAVTDRNEFGRWLKLALPENGNPDESEWNTLATLQLSLDRNRIPLTSLLNSNDAEAWQAALRLRKIHDSALKTAANGSNSLSLRRAAVRLAGRGFNDFASALPELARLLKPNVPAALQSDVFSAISRKDSKQLPSLALAGWRTHSVSLRQQIIATLIRREHWIMALMDAIEDRRIAAGEINHVTRLQLARSRNPKLATRAEKLIPVTIETDRAKLLTNYEPTFQLQGDTANGRVHFQQLCAPCHASSGIGTNVGPDLAIYRNKPARDIVEAIINPNAVIEPQFMSYAAETTDGRVISGILRESAGSLEFLQAQGIRTKLRRDEVKSLGAVALSLMPEGFEAALNPQQMADLIAFLKAP
jgi:putative membrane-bound dehydrogenase-like protein